MMVSVMTIFVSQARSPHGQGYCCHIRNNSLGNTVKQELLLYFRACINNTIIPKSGPSPNCADVILELTYDESCYISNGKI